MPKFFQCFASFKLIQKNINYLENICLKINKIYIKKRKKKEGVRRMGRKVMVR